MMGSQCDTCRKFAPSAPVGWFILATIEAPQFSGILSALSGSSLEREPKTFCSPKCVAEYAYVLAVSGSPGEVPG